MDVLNAVAESRGPATLMKLSGQLEMAPSKLHRYLVSLCRSRMVVRYDDTGLYDLGPAAYLLGAIGLARFEGFDLVYEGMRALSLRLGMNGFVYVWTEAGPALVRSQTVTQSIITLRIGSRVPLTESAIGPVFLAYLPETMTGEALERDIRAGSLDAGATRRHFFDELCPTIRERGVFWSEKSLLPFLSACAAPIFDAQSELYCVIGVVTPTGDNSVEQDVVAAVLGAARDISFDLGWNGDVGGDRQVAKARAPNGRDPEGRKHRSAVRRATTRGATGAEP